jgi:hypothetical protein
MPLTMNTISFSDFKFRKFALDISLKNGLLASFQYVKSLRRPTAHQFLCKVLCKFYCMKTTASPKDKRLSGPAVHIDLNVESKPDYIYFVDFKISEPVFSASPYFSKLTE